MYGTVRTEVESESKRQTKERLRSPRVMCSSQISGPKSDKYNNVDLLYQSRESEKKLLGRRNKREGKPHRGIWNGVHPLEIIRSLLKKGIQCFRAKPVGEPKLWSLRHVTRNLALITSHTRHESHSPPQQTPSDSPNGEAGTENATHSGHDHPLNRTSH